MSTEIEPVEAETHIEIEAGQTTAIDADERRANEAALAPAEQSSEVDASERPLPQNGHLNLCEMEMNEDNTKRLISEMGDDVLNQELPEGHTMVHAAIFQLQLTSAKLLFEYAKHQQVYVNMRVGNGDILRWAIDQGSQRCVVFLLERLLAKCATPEQTASILKSNTRPLLDRFPHLMEDYLKHDRFCIETGRFTVPQSIFKGSDECPVAITVKQVPNWATVSSTELRHFWTGNNEALTTDRFWKLNNAEVSRMLSDTSDTQVAAVSKFVCIESVICDGNEGLMFKLLSGHASADVFKTDAVRSVIQWFWHTMWRKTFFACFALHIIASVSFSIFASMYALDPEGSRDLQSPSAYWPFYIAFFISGILGGLVVQPKLRYFSFWIFFVINDRMLHSASYNQLTAFLISFECLSSWVSVLWYLQPFRPTGPLISMILYVLWDIMSFAILGFIVIIGFGLAFLVLLSNSFVEDDGEHFNSPLRSLESLFYALLGEFDPEIFRSAPDGFLSMWRTVLFNGFLFLGPVVILSLLISILGDTYDRVQLTQEAELIKCRARMITSCAWVHHSMCKLGHFFKPLYSRCEDCKLGYLLFLLFALQIILLALSMIYGWLIVWLFGVLVTTFVISFGIRVLVTDQVGKYFVFLVPAEPLLVDRKPVWQGKLHALKKLIGYRLNENDGNVSTDNENLKEDVKQLMGESSQTATEVAALKSQMDNIEMQNNRIEAALCELLQTQTKVESSDDSASATTARESGPI